MYADRYAPPPVNRTSLTLSLTICGSLLAAALASPTVVRHFTPDPGLPIYPVPLDPLPKPEPQKPAPLQKTRPAPHPDAPRSLVPTEPDRPFTVIADPQPPFEPGVGTGTGEGTAIVDPPKPPPPVLTQPGIDPRYARDFQPGYPPAERRAGREGAVIVRVLIGVDGRVRDIQQVSAASDTFWRVTRERALARWRFTPGTRDGIPVEAWRTMTVRFVLESDG